jgi:hypothetical protein
MLFLVVFSQHKEQAQNLYDDLIISCALMVEDSILSTLLKWLIKLFECLLILVKTISQAM